MRFTAYAGASVALATSVILKALHERANFYSACVYLAQSNACIMILTNLVLLALGCLLFGLQKLLYGPLRAIEVEQLYEKAWFAITETCLAMTIFRDEVGAWFIVMFVSLLVGKVWAWIGEGRVEILEQQPPSNPRLFHARLSSSLALSFLFDAYFLNYSISAVRNQAEMNMMVMFAFEFALLTISSLSTSARYALSLREAAVIQKQTAQRLEESRALRLRERNTAIRQANDNGDDPPEFPPLEDEIDELDIDVPGWEEKGRWAFYLDLATDFFKLILYLTFFCILCIFYGMPIHIIRDVALTVRSFYNRVSDFIKYRHATRDMNERYADATADEIQREDTCIICREPMRPWQPPGPVQGEGPAPMEERLRPKKLPCGHILHFACLRSWLERQQKCPTCRQDVVVSPAAQSNQHRLGRPRDVRGPEAGRQARAGGLARDGDAEGGWRAAGGNGANGNNGGARNRFRTFNIGPARIGIGFGAGEDVQRLRGELRDQMLQAPNQHNDAAAEDELRALEEPHDTDRARALIRERMQAQQQLRNATAAREDLERLREELRNHMQQPQGTAEAREELQRIGEEFRSHLRQPQNQLPSVSGPNPPERLDEGINEMMSRVADHLVRTSEALTIQREQLRVLQGMHREFERLSTRREAVELGDDALAALAAPPSAGIQGYGPPSEQQQPLGHQHPDLPPGVTIPEGWHLMPLTQVAPPTSADGPPQTTNNASHNTPQTSGPPHPAQAAVPVPSSTIISNGSEVPRSDNAGVGGEALVSNDSASIATEQQRPQVAPGAVQGNVLERSAPSAPSGNLPSWGSGAGSSQDPPLQTDVSQPMNGKHEESFAPSADSEKPGSKSKHRASNVEDVPDEEEGK